MAAKAKVSKQVFWDLFGDESGESDGSDIDFEGFTDEGREEGSESEENDGEDDENSNDSGSDYWGTETRRRLFKIRPVLNDVLNKARNTYEPSKNISVDEGMIAFKGRLAFRQ